MKQFDLVRLAAIVKANPSDSKAAKALARAVEITQGIAVDSVYSDIAHIEDACKTGDDSAAIVACRALDVGMVVERLAINYANAIRQSCDYQLADVFGIHSVGMDEIAPDFQQYLIECEIYENAHSEKLKSEAQFVGASIIHFEQCAEDFFELLYMNENGNSELPLLLRECLSRFFSKKAVAEMFRSEIEQQAGAIYKARVNIENFSENVDELFLGLADDVMLQHHKNVVDGSAYDNGLDEDDHDYDSQSRGFDIINTIESAVIDCLSEYSEGRESLGFDSLRDWIDINDFESDIDGAMWKLWVKCCELEGQGRNADDWNTNGSWVRMLDIE